MYREIKKCRICGNEDLVPVLDLGNQHLTGIFPKSKNERTTAGPLELVKCCAARGANRCGLLQLRHSYLHEEIYGMHYGYRSGLNRSMVDHLHGKVKEILASGVLQKNDLILDIGSNDGTLLRFYPPEEFTLAGIDPTCEKFGEFYPDHVVRIANFFGSDIVKKHFGAKKAKLVTSISMFYDLESPLDFMREVCDVLADDGLWIFEQSYMPTMLQMNAYDTVCHEHLAYYALKQILWMAERVGFKIVHVAFNAVNGGSFSVTMAKKSSKHREGSIRIGEILKQEDSLGLDGIDPFSHFRKRVHRHREELIRFMENKKREKKTVFGYGASTKGNVILQFCGLTEEHLPCIAEINPDKFRCFTPGTKIPIIPEEEARAMTPDYFMVLPWHFKDSIVEREETYLRNGGGLIMPLPEIDIVNPFR